MKIKLLISSLLMIGFTVLTYGQTDEFYPKLYKNYDSYKEASLKQRRIKHADIQPLINPLKSNPNYTVQKVGESVEGRSISMISVGTGKRNILLWSQMHGDEPTATQAIFDLINFLNSDDFPDEKKLILKKLKLHFIPMLNPDGAQQFKRRNALGIDLNRDALRLQTPEGRTLKRMRDSLDAEVGFNLHDQSRYYNAERTSKPATISYLATAYNYEKDVNKTRATSMKVISFMNEIIQNYAPGQVGRYNDDFEPRAFGDNIQKWGTSLILIESGGYQNDLEKQEIRKLNFVSILAALETLADKSYKKIKTKEYEKIPMNDRKMFDLKLEKLTFKKADKSFTIDLGVYRYEVDNTDHSNFFNRSQIVDIGDLSTYYGYETFNGSGYTITPGKVYTKGSSMPTKEEAIQLLKQGYLYYQTEELIDHQDITIPMMLVSKEFMPQRLDLNIGLNPSFLLEKSGVITHAVVNGFLIDLEKGVDSSFRNALYLK